MEDLINKANALQVLVSTRLTLGQSQNVMFGETIGASLKSLDSAIGQLTTVIASDLTPAVPAEAAPVAQAADTDGKA